MTQQLTLEHIAHYLPYGLKVNSPDNQVYELTAWPYAGRNLTYIQEFFENEDEPILRPMDLTKAIQVEGTEVIPIVELAKIAFPDEDWRKPNGVFYYPKARNSYPKIPIDFTYNNGFSAVKDHCHYDAQNIYIPNQLALFQWLFKHKFDVFNLIERGLAIDVNTLETNPYE